MNKQENLTEAQARKLAFEGKKVRANLWTDEDHWIALNKCGDLAWGGGELIYVSRQCDFESLWSVVDDNKKIPEYLVRDQSRKIRKFLVIGKKKDASGSFYHEQWEPAKDSKGNVSLLWRDHRLAECFYADIKKDEYEEIQIAPIDVIVQ